MWLTVRTLAFTLDYTNNETYRFRIGDIDERLESQRLQRYDEKKDADACHACDDDEDLDFFGTGSSSTAHIGMPNCEVDTPDGFFNVVEEEEQPTELLKEAIDTMFEPGEAASVKELSNECDKFDDGEVLAEARASDHSFAAPSSPSKDDELSPCTLHLIQIVTRGPLVHVILRIAAPKRRSAASMR